MKKTVSLFLALIMLLSLVACGAQKEATKAIVGEWKSLGESSQLSFYEDGTGEKTSDRADENSVSLTWKYDEELSVYMMAVEDNVYSFSIETDDEDDAIPYVNPFGTKYYASEGYDEQVKKELKNAEKELEETIQAKEKVVLGKKYTGEKIDVTYNLKTNNGKIWLQADIANRGSEPIYMYEIQKLYSEICPLSLTYVYWINGWKNDAWTGGGDTNIKEYLEFTDDILNRGIAPGQTRTVELELNDTQTSIELYGKVIGYIQCSIFDPVTKHKTIAYIDLRDCAA